LWSKSSVVETKNIHTIAEEMQNVHIASNTQEVEEFINEEER